MRIRLAKLARAEDGNAAVELALVGALLAACLMNVAEAAHYAYQASEVNAAAQAGAQAALNACDEAHTPATLNCPPLSNAVTTAIQSSSLGRQIVLEGSIAEGYYCLTPTGALQRVSDASRKPIDCSAAKNTQASPTLYLQVPVTFTYEAIFPGLTIVNTFATPITRTAWMRMS